VSTTRGPGDGALREGSILSLGRLIGQQAQNGTYTARRRVPFVAPHELPAENGWLDWLSWVDRTPTPIVVIHVVTGTAVLGQLFAVDFSSWATGSFTLAACLGAILAAARLRRLKGALWYAIVFAGLMGALEFCVALRPESHSPWWECCSALRCLWVRWRWGKGGSRRRKIGYTWRCYCPSEPLPSPDCG